MAAVPGGPVSLRAALYLRLSRDDAGAGESVSIGGQRALLRAYAADHGWTVAGEYVDDGFSGTSFRRPGLQRLLEDVEAERVDLVLTKDLSRLGRDYIRTGELAEVYFPSRHVRYIAVNDGFDTQGPDNGLAPFQHVVNEMYARDASKKIRSALAVRRSQGRYVGSLAPYGYRKDPADKNKLLPDPPAAAVVGEIFAQAAAGVRPGEIAHQLNSRGVACPALHRSGERPWSDGPVWTASTVSKLLRNPTYLGCTAQGRTRKPSFKAKIREAVPRERWTVVEGTHPALVDRETFLLAARRSEGRTGTGRFQNRLAGLIRCGACDGAMVSAGTRRKDSPAVLVCPRYKRKGPSACGSHAIHYPVLKDLLSRFLRQAVTLTAQARAEILDELVCRAAPEHGGERKVALETELRRLDRLEGELWDSHLMGELEETRFRMLLDRTRILRQEAARKIEACPQEEEIDLIALRAELERILDQILSAPAEDQRLLFSLVASVEVGGREEDGTLPLQINLAFPVPEWAELLERSGPMDYNIWKVLSLNGNGGAVPEPNAVERKEL